MLSLHTQLFLGTLFTRFVSDLWEYLTFLQDSICAVSHMLDGKACPAVSSLIHPKVTVSGWGQGSVQAGQVPPNLDS